MTNDCRPEVICHYSEVSGELFILKASDLKRVRVNARAQYMSRQ